MFGSRLGFSGMADRKPPLPVGSNRIDCVFGSMVGLLASADYIALFNLTAHELHELYYDRPTS